MAWFRRPAGNIGENQSRELPDGLWTNATSAAKSSIKNNWRRTPTPAKSATSTFASAAANISHYFLTPARLSDGRGNPLGGPAAVCGFQALRRAHHTDDSQDRLERCAAHRNGNARIAPRRRGVHGFRVHRREYGERGGGGVRARAGTLRSGGAFRSSWFPHPAERACRKAALLADATGENEFQTRRTRRRHIPYISIMTDPITGGCSCQFRHARRREHRRAGRAHRLRRSPRHRTDHP